jgi:hypothetical protein
MRSAWLLGRLERRLEAAQVVAPRIRAASDSTARRRSKINIEVRKP